MISNIKAKAKAFLVEFKLGEVTLDGLKRVIKSQGYTLIEFNHVSNSEDVENLIKLLGVSKYIEQTKGFAYADEQRRLVFLHEDLSDEEKLLVLAHEEGHIYCGHISSTSIMGKDVVEEYEANEFTHYILNKSIPQRFSTFVKTHRKGFVGIAMIVLILTVGVLIFSYVQKEKSYYGEYYITSTGNKYHEKDCIFAKDKNNTQRLTVEQFESGEYEPCGTCLPD